MAKAVKNVQPAPSIPKAVAVLEMANQTYKGEGKTVAEALMAIPMEYTQVKYKGTIRVEQDGKSFERLFPLMPLRRIFASKVYKEHWANAVQKFLK